MHVHWLHRTGKVIAYRSLIVVAWSCSPLNEIGNLTLSVYVFIIILFAATTRSKGKGSV